MKTFQITNSVSFLCESTRNMFIEFDKIVKKFITIEKLGYDISLLQNIRKILIDYKKQLIDIKSKYYEINEINHNLLTIIKGEVDPIVSSYNCISKRTDKKSKIEYEFVIPEKDKLILEESSTDDGFADAMIKCAEIKNSKDKIIFLGFLLKKFKKEYENINKKIDKLDERIQLTNNSKCPECQIAFKKKNELKEIQKIIDGRFRTILQMFFSIRKQMIKNLTDVSEPFISLFPNGNENIRELSLKYSIKSDLEDLLVAENHLTKTDKRFKVTSILS